VVIQRSLISLDRLLSVCDLIYTRDGFVTWAEVGKTLGVSRQAVQLRLRAAVEKGDVSPELVEKYQSMSARRAITAQRSGERRKELNRLELRIMLTPENYTWLQQETTDRHCTRADIINGLINKARQG
jgi:hypothetical protein